LLEYVSIVLLFTAVIMLSLSLFLLRKSLRIYKGVKALLEPHVKSVKKPRKRYVVFVALCEDKVYLNNVEEAVKKAFIEYYGKSMYHKASPQLILYDENSGRGVIRVLHTCTDHLLATLGLVKKINDKNCLLLPLRTTGTLKKAREYLEKLRI